MPSSMTWIPDTKNPDHDPRFWCLPKIHDTPSERKGGGYPLYLITDGREVGIWHNWTVAKKMVEGYPSNGYRGHHTLEGCVNEWQLHCARGAHAHLADPKLSSPTQTPNGQKGRRVNPQLQADLFTLELNIFVVGFIVGFVGFDVEYVDNNVD
ncbi:hypothetical protein B0H16DRAFT_1735566 [Mycena metata]|uniref:Ribonuclease H1 N-terminal domain-containing protein n=1 Tax=Mycena metata TaxID=1033252 RepID=A0AAD7HT68_9AGAR|nr:hypothetical protein B0H16DRAFT_1735566 [Mycena metata]